MDLDNVRMNLANSDVLDNPNTYILELPDQFNKILGRNVPDNIEGKTNCPPLTLSVTRQ